MGWRMLRRTVVLWVLCSIAPVLSAAQAESPSNAKAPHVAGHALLAPTPPMGWNSWDGYGTTIDEKEFRANADWFAKNLKPFGWQYVTIDMEWFVTNPTAAGNSKQSKFQMDGFGRYTPPTSRFPSAANNAGFKPLATFADPLGLKFGIHIP